MSAGRRTRIAVGALLASVLAASAAIVGIAAPAGAVDIDVAFDFGIVLPGQVLEQRIGFTVPTDATVATVDVGTPVDPAFGVITASACSVETGCIPVSSLAGRDLPKGQYELVAVLTVADDLQSGTVASVSGRITIVERVTGLAGTGSTLVPVLGFTAAGVLAVGGIALAIAARRRRSRDAG